MKFQLESSLEEAKTALKTCEVINEIIETKKTEAQHKVSSVFAPVLDALSRKQKQLTEEYLWSFNSVISRLNDTRCSLEDVINKRQKVLDTSLDINIKLQRTAGTERLRLVSQMETLTKIGEVGDISGLMNEAKELKVREIEVSIDTILQAIEAVPCQIRPMEPINMPPVPSIPDEEDQPSQRALATVLMESYGLSRRIYEVLASTDRKDFMPAESNAYDDRPQKIGFNTTISAPHMHAMTLRMLEDRLHPGIKVLDVGCGSGYLTVCLGKMITQGRVFGLDHIEELINQACENVMKSHFLILTGNEVEIRFVTGDGRDGLPSEAPFDVIHIGAATPEVPPKLLQQLALGGRMMLPLGPQNGYQQIVVIDKDREGQLKQTGLISVNYAPLTDRKNQCP